VVISRGADKVTLAKTGDRWVVAERAGFPVSFSDLKALLLKLQGLKVVQTDDISDSQLARLQLAGPDAGTNAATVLELRDVAGKVLRSVLLGKKHLQTPADGSEGWPDGRYVMAEAGSGHVQVVADALSEVEPAAANWVDKDFVKPDHVISLTVNFPAGTNSWSLTRTNDTADWQLVSPAKGEKLDSSKLSDLAQPLSGLSLADVLTNATAGQNPVTLEAKTLDGFDYVFTVGTKTNDNYPVRFTLSAALSTNTLAVGETWDSAKDKLAHDAALTNWAYLVPSWNLDSVLKGRADWLVVVTNTGAK